MAVYGGETKVVEDSHLLEFYGTECVHCRHMDPLIVRLKDELGLEVKKVEVWHNSENAKLLRKYDQGFCGGVPFFYNLKTSKWICGNVDYDRFKKWALGE